MSRNTRTNKTRALGDQAIAFGPDTPTFIHVGYPKCASTYLQQSIFPSMGNFADLTKTPRETKWMLFDDDADAAVFRELVAAATAHRNPEKNYHIVSYEGFVPNLFRPITDLFWETRKRQGASVDRYAHATRPIAERLAEAFPGAKIIIVIREQVDWAISQYKMYWRRGHTTKPLEAFVEDYCAGYDREIARFMDLFGRENVVVVPFELLLEDALAFVRAITGFIDPDFEPEAPKSRVNFAPKLLRDVSYQRAKRILKIQMREHRFNTNPLSHLMLKIAWWGATVVARPYYAIKFGNQEDTIALDPAKHDEIRPALIQSNRTLEDLTGLSLAQYGYCTGAEDQG